MRGIEVDRIEEKIMDSQWVDWATFIKDEKNEVADVCRDSWLLETIMQEIICLLK